MDTKCWPLLFFSHFLRLSMRQTPLQDGKWILYLKSRSCMLLKIIQKVLSYLYEYKSETETNCSFLRYDRHLISWKNPTLLRRDGLEMTLGTRLGKTNSLTLGSNQISIRQCGPGSITPRVFSPATPVCFFSQKSTFPNSNWIWDVVKEDPLY